MDTFVHTGWLVKRKERFVSDRDRFFTLDDNDLKYYTNESMQNRKGCISLEDVTAVSFFADHFLLQTIHKTYVLEPLLDLQNKSQAMQEWADAFTQVRTLANCDFDINDQIANGSQTARARRTSLLDRMGALTRRMSSSLMLSRRHISLNACSINEYLIIAVRPKSQALLDELKVLVEHQGPTLLVDVSSPSPNLPQLFPALEPSHHHHHPHPVVCHTPNQAPMLLSQTKQTCASMRSFLSSSISRSSSSGTNLAASGGLINPLSNSFGGGHSKHPQTIVLLSDRGLGPAATIVCCYLLFSREAMHPDHAMLQLVTSFNSPKNHHSSHTSTTHVKDEQTAGSLNVSLNKLLTASEQRYVRYFAECIKGANRVLEKLPVRVRLVRCFLSCCPRFDTIGGSDPYFVVDRPCWAESEGEGQPPMVVGEHRSTKIGGIGYVSTVGRDAGDSEDDDTEAVGSGGRGGQDPDNHSTRVSSEASTAGVSASPTANTRGSVDYSRSSLGHSLSSLNGSMLMLRVFNYRDAYALTHIDTNKPCTLVVDKPVFEVEGDFRITFYDHDKGATLGDRMFSLWLNTRHLQFDESGVCLLTLKREELDNLKLDKFAENFHLQLTFELA